MLRIVQTKVECSECGSTDHESVTYLGETFVRCRGCGHEGVKSPLYPSQSGESSGVFEAWVKKLNDVRKF